MGNGYIGQYKTPWKRLCAIKDKERAEEFAKCQRNNNKRLAVKVVEENE